MDWYLFWAIAGVVVTSAAALFAWYVYAKQNPRRRIDVTLTATQILAPEGQHGDFEVRFRGHTVRNPHLVRIDVFSNSRADIPSSSFDAGQSISLKISGGDMAPVVRSRPGEIEVTLGDTVGEFVIAPQLIRKGSRAEMQMVTSGPTDLSIASPLIDVEVRQVKDQQIQSAVQKLVTSRAHMWAVWGTILAAYVIGSLWLR